MAIATSLNLLSTHSQPWVKKVLYAKKYEREAETVTALRHTCTELLSGLNFMRT